MNNFECYNPVKISFGKGTIARLEALIPPNSKVLFLYGGGSIKKNGVYNQVVTALKSFDVVEFAGIEANPQYKTCMQAVQLVHETKRNFLLAVGGGSVVDATKFIASAVCFDGAEPWDILSKGSLITKALPLGVVMTMAATGSEMNERAVISRAETNEKLAFATPFVFPQFAVLDPEVTYSLPIRQVANGVVDSFIHVVEQYLTYPVNAKVQDYTSEGLMRVIHEEGLKVMEQPNDYDIRANLMWAATNALNCWIGQGVPQDWASHRMGYSLTVHFGLSHAETLAVLLPGVVEYMRKEKWIKILSLGSAVFGITEGLEEERVNKTLYELENFFKQMGFKTRLSDYGIKEADLDMLVEPVKQMGWHLGEHANIDSTVAKKIFELRL